MIEFSDLSNVVLKEGAEKFLAVSFVLAHGQIGANIRPNDVKTHWPQHLLNSSYSPAFYPAALRKKWVLRDTRKPGTFIVTKLGAEHLDSLTSPAADSVRGLLVFDPKTAHQFDKTIRSILMGSKSVDIADSYVDDMIFDTILDVIPKVAQVRLLYGQVAPSEKQSVFLARAKRFTIEYSEFAFKQFSDFHDRFLIVDGVGYLLGPSLKDAASKKPALLMHLGGHDSKKLQNFFERLWPLGR